MSDPASADRRKFRRIHAPVSVRAVGPGVPGALLPAVADIGAGGLRAYSDLAYEIGTAIELDLCFPEGEPARVLAEVAWRQPLPAGAPARFDVGLRFLRIRPEDLARIAGAELR